MYIQKLKYFLQLSKDLNISKASSNLFITQQGLSKSMKSLEEELNTVLFKRTPQGIKLTKSGLLLKDHAEKVIREISILKSELDNLKKESKEILKVGFALGVLNALSTDLIQDFQKLNPTVDLRFKEYSDYICHSAVLNDELDLGVIIGPVDSSKFNFQVIKSHIPHALVNKLHPLYKNTSLRINDLKGEKIIIVNENFQMHHNFIRHCYIAGFKPKIILTTGEILIPYKMSRLGRGIGITVDFVSEDISYDNVKSIPLLGDGFTWDITVIAKKNKTQRKVCKSFIDYLHNIGK
ncbi:LysR family transcriptional regulator [Maledivibacter halophilus]|uniref:DNA-binding transcriptional regulator, LysR family n=1 Tax=Maledivibacter halophilus TaxID=36842 RepID=A0A1T5M9C3_9FIRM|nr:LysR family transcriptional regulator [Maledivibacter halophilus]SKC84469.1 DNA-binding transcriptional regulator, LysR family [Maledivibacter halophilus]